MGAPKGAAKRVPYICKVLAADGLRKGSGAEAYFSPTGRRGGSHRLNKLEIPTVLAKVACATRVQNSELTLPYYFSSIGTTFSTPTDFERPKTQSTESSEALMAANRQIRVRYEFSTNGRAGSNRPLVVEQTVNGVSTAFEDWFVIFEQYPRLPQ